MFQAYDCSLVEINPLVVTSDGQMLALDAKVTFDDNALYRHKDLLPLEDPDEKDPLELEATKHNLNYITFRRHYRRHGQRRRPGHGHDGSN